MSKFKFRLWLCSMGLLATSMAGAASLVKETDACGFGLFAWCLWQAPAKTSSAAPWRTEVFAGYKPGMRYYEEELSACREGGSCTFEAEGASIGADLYRNISGDNSTSDYTDLGLQYSRMPVANWKSDQAFEGSLDNRIEAGSGRLRYHFVRLAVKRSQFLYFLHSKYLISSFGVGVGIPEAQGVAEDFVGGNQLVPSIGGKLGFQYPLTSTLDVGIASNWNVLWYGRSMSDSAFLAAYGLNLSARI